jgi:hypothetical protein
MLKAITVTSISPLWLIVPILSELILKENDSTYLERVLSIGRRVRWPRHPSGYPVKENYLGSTAGRSDRISLICWQIKYRVTHCNVILHFGDLDHDGHIAMNNALAERYL